MRTLLVVVVVLLSCVAGIGKARNASINQADAQSPAVSQSSNEDDVESLKRRVISLYKQRKFDEALPLAQRVLALCEQAAGNDEIQVALAASNLAAIYYAKDDYARAKPLLERTANLYAQKPDVEPLMYSQTLQSLAALEILDKEYVKAESLYRRAVMVEEKKLGATHPNLALSFLQLARLTQLRGDNKQAKQLYGRALDAYESLPRPVSESIANTLEAYMCKMIEVNESKDRVAIGDRIGQILADPPVPDIAPTAEALLSGRRALRGGVLNGKAVYRQVPRYPAEAMSRQVEGVVIVLVDIDEAGNVTDAKARCGYDVLRKASVDAARRWKFSPTVLSGKPVKVTGTIFFYFTRNKPHEFQ